MGIGREGTKQGEETGKAEKKHPEVVSPVPTGSWTRRSGLSTLPSQGPNLLLDFLPGFPQHLLALFRQAESAGYRQVSVGMPRGYRTPGLTLRWAHLCSRPPGSLLSTRNPRIPGG